MSTQSASEQAIAKLLRDAEHAHGVYETGVLGGVFDEAWPAWYAAYLLDHGVGEHLAGGDAPTVESLAATLKQLAADYEREQPAHPWPDVYARQLAAGVE